MRQNIRYYYLPGLQRGLQEIGSISQSSREEGWRGWMMVQYMQHWQMTNRGDSLAGHISTQHTKDGTYINATRGVFGWYSKFSSAIPAGWTVYCILFGCLYCLSSHGENRSTRLCCISLMASLTCYPHSEFMSHHHIWNDFVYEPRIKYNNNMTVVPKQQDESSGQRKPFNGRSCALILTIVF